MHKVTIYCENQVVANVVVKLFNEAEIQALINRRLKKLELEMYSVSETEANVNYDSDNDSTNHEVNL